MSFRITQRYSKDDMMHYHALSRVETWLECDTGVITSQCPYYPFWRKTRWVCGDFRLSWMVLQDGEVVFLIIGGKNLGWILQLSRKTLVLWAVFSHCCWLKSSFLFFCVGESVGYEHLDNRFSNLVRTAAGFCCLFPSFMDPCSREWQQLGVSRKRS